MATDGVNSLAQGGSLPTPTSPPSQSATRQWRLQGSLGTGIKGKVVHNEDQVRVLEWVFINYSKYPSRSFKMKLANMIRMKYIQVQVWFQTRRQRGVPILIQKNPIRDQKKWTRTLKAIQMLIEEEGYVSRTPQPSGSRSPLSPSPTRSPPNQLNSQSQLPQSVMDGVHGMVLVREEIPQQQQHNHRSPLPVITTTPVSISSRSNSDPSSVLVPNSSSNSPLEQFQSSFRFSSSAHSGQQVVTPSPNHQPLPHYFASPPSYAPSSDPHPSLSFASPPSFSSPENKYQLPLPKGVPHTSSAPVGDFPPPPLLPPFQQQPNPTTITSPSVPLSFFRPLPQAHKPSPSQETSSLPSFRNLISFEQQQQPPPRALELPPLRSLYKFD